jgi:hypothetical protein
MRVATASVSFAQEMILAEDGLEAETQGGSREEAACCEELEPGPP